MHSHAAGTIDPMLFAVASHDDDAELSTGAGEGGAGGEEFDVELPDDGVLIIPAAAPAAAGADAVAAGDEGSGDSSSSSSKGGGESGEEAEEGNGGDARGPLPEI